MYEVKLDAFNGPLDLLLHLIQKFEIDIYDIPMKSLTEQYMQYIHAMNQLEINVASEYLVMASELLMIKSKLLLPQTETEIELEDDPREDLVGRLIEYQNYKEYTELLNSKKAERTCYFSKHPTDLSSFYTFLIASTVTIVVSFIVTWVWGYNDKMVQGAKVAKKKRPGSK